MGYEAVHQLPPTASAAAAGLRAGDYTSVELTTAVMARADSVDSDLGSYVVRFDDALDRAREADLWFARGIDRSMFQGVPIGLKDVIAFDRGPTRANSRILDPDWPEGGQGQVAMRLEQAGAVIVGKQTTFEFATGYPDPAKTSAIPRNPWDLNRTAGGSSSGTASAVGAGLALGGVGTDTGGSIRVPSAYCGVTGLKTTYGLVPKSGCVPLVFSLDSVGPIGRSARDCAGLLAVIAGHDPGDVASVGRPPDDYLGALVGDLRGVTVGLVQPDLWAADAHPDLAGRLQDAIEVLRFLGATAVPVTLPLYDEVRWAWSVTFGAEAFAYHRNDLRSRWDDYHEMTRLNIAQGALCSGADYVQASRVRRAAQQELRELFARVDLVISPTVGEVAPLVRDTYEPRVSPRAGRSFTVYWSAVGYPAMAAPIGFSTGGLPLSFQVAGRPFGEAAVLRLGDAYQSVTDWHLRVPPLTEGVLEDVQADSTAVAGDGDVVATAPPLDRVGQGLIARAGLQPGDRERVVLDAAYRQHAAGVEALYRVPAEMYSDPAALFRAR
jgi:aspartyl-tRNA(Asn)/glutamyl-tRNA(Gln) amidotransferase subunit A